MSYVRNERSFNARCGLAARLFAIVAGALIATSCGGESGPPLIPTDEARALLERAHEQARLDSIALKGAAFEADGTLIVEMRQDERRVNIEQRFRLTKSRNGRYVTDPVSRSVTGDSTLLDDMYSFEDPKGNPRAVEQSQLDRLNFGSDFLELLRTLERRNRGYAMDEKIETIDGRPSRGVRYSADGVEGRFWLSVDSAKLVRMESAQESDYGVGRYAYRMTTDFTRPTGAFPVPMQMESAFDFRRLFNAGSGRMTVTLGALRPSVAASVQRPDTLR